MRIEKKIWPRFFDEIQNGVKSFEIRLGDFGCNPGDVLVLNEWDPSTKDYTGRVMEERITSKINTKELDFWSEDDVKKHGLSVMSLSRIRMSSEQSDKLIYYLDRLRLLMIAFDIDTEELDDLTFEIKRQTSSFRVEGKKIF